MQLAFHGIEELVAAMKDRHIKMNRWARDLRLPPTWRSAGTYELVVDNAESKALKILHRPLWKDHIVNPKLLAFAKDLNGMRVDKNFFERRAQPVDTHGAFKCLIVGLCFSAVEDFAPFSAEEPADSLAEEDEDSKAKSMVSGISRKVQEASEESTNGPESDKRDAGQLGGTQGCARAVGNEEGFIPPAAVDA